MQEFVCLDELKTNITYVDFGYCKMLAFYKTLMTFWFSNIFYWEKHLLSCADNNSNRISQGVRTILPYLGKRIVEISVEDMCKILKAESGNSNCPRDELECDEKFLNISSGSVVLVSEYNGYFPLLFSIELKYVMHTEVWMLWSSYWNIWYC